MKMSMRLIAISIGIILLLAVGGLLSREKQAASVPAASTAADTVFTPTVHEINPALTDKPTALAQVSADRTSVVSSQSNASVARFDRAHTCHETTSKLKNWQAQLDVCRSAGQKDANFAERCRKNTDGFAEKIADANRQLSQCSAVPAEIEADFYRTSIEAAKAGDPTAQLCYLQSNFDLKRSFTDDEVAYYRSVDAGYINGAIDRGDWRAIALMAQRKRDPAHRPTMRGQLTGDDPYTLYQMNRLLGLGADGDFRRSVNNEAEIAKEELTDDQIDQADKWASQVYEKHFASSPRLGERPAICESHM
jgi:hypothetical protein